MKAIRKTVLAVGILLSFAFSAKGQLYAPCYANYCGIGYFNLPNGYYYGHIYGGFPHGEGYYYYQDPESGPIFYHGYFSRGLCHGLGEVVSTEGYICGTWNNGVFVSQRDVQPSQMQKTYTNVWSNYWNNYATSSSYNPNINWNWNWNQYTAPSYNYQQPYPNYNYSNTQASNSVRVPENTTITQIDSDSALGRQLLGRIGR